MRRMLGELHTRMAASGHLAADRTALRTEYLPTLRTALTRPLSKLEKEGIPPVLDIMQARLSSCQEQQRTATTGPVTPGL